jgi:hypothetical protein
VSVEAVKQLADVAQSLMDPPCQVVAGGMTPTTGKREGLEKGLKEAANAAG